MKYVVRRNVFETNSSSTHSVTIFNNELKNKPRVLTSSLEKLNFLYRLGLRSNIYNAKNHEKNKQRFINSFAKHSNITTDEAKNIFVNYLSSNPLCPVCSKQHSLDDYNCPINDFDLIENYLSDNNFVDDVFSNKISINILHEYFKYGDKIEKQKIIISRGSVYDVFVKEPFDKLMFMVASNEYKIAQEKINFCNKLKHNVILENNKEYLYENLELLDRLLEHKSCTPENFIEIFGAYRAVKNDNLFYTLLNHRLNSNFDFIDFEPEFKPAKKEHINTKFYLMKYKGTYYPKYFFNSLTMSMNMIFKMEKYYSIFIDVYTEITGEKRENVINKLKNKNRNKEYNPLTFTPMCINFFCDGPLCDECVDCYCNIDNIFNYITKVDSESDMSNLMQIKSRVMKIFNDEILIDYNESL